MAAASGRLDQIRLKSSAPTFSGIEFACQKTCVTTVGSRRISLVNGLLTFVGSCGISDAHTPPRAAGFVEPPDPCISLSDLWPAVSRVDDADLAEGSGTLLPH